MSDNKVKVFTVRFDDETSAKILRMQKFFGAKSMNGTLKKTVAAFYQALEISGWDECLTVVDEKSSDNVKFFLKM